MSVLDYIPPTGDRKAYRLQVSIGLKEAAELEHLLVAEDLPFQGDMSCLVRTLITFGITQLHKELGTDSYIQSIKHIIGAEILKWSTQYCDSFAVSSVDHLYLALESGDTERAEEVFNQVVEVITSVENKAAHAMLLHHLDKRGFTKTAIKLREAMIQSDINVYHFDNTYAEVFN